jgi:EEF1A N-terminal glycine/lysine methyltransferase
MLLTRISIPTPPQTEPEDIFHSALTTIFTDDTVNSHGTPGSYVTYSSPRFGDLKLYIPAHPDVEDGRRLFAHYLWNAAVVAADAIESASRSLEAQDGSAQVNGDAQWNKKYFDVRNKTTLELGAGT